MTPLVLAFDRSRFGGKAAALAKMCAAGLRVPKGFALDAAELDALANGADADARWASARELGAAVAVRSSATEEDGALHSFAGQHASVLGISSKEALVEAARVVNESGAGSAAYRKARGLDEGIELAAVVQRLIEPICSGVFFTRDPGGADEMVIEAAWGLGETVVQGLVVPDRARLQRDGTVIALEPGDKDLQMIRVGPEVVERPVPPADRAAFSVPNAIIAELAALADACESIARGPADVEWAWDGAALWLVQCRAITTL